MILAILLFIVLTLLTAHTGLAWSGVLLKKDNIFEDLAKQIRKIPSKYLRNLLQCHKCVSGQFTLWTYVFAHIYFQLPFTIWSLMFPVAWVSLVIVVTDQLYKFYKYDKKEETAAAIKFFLWAVKERNIHYNPDYSPHSWREGGRALDMPACPEEEFVQQLFQDFKDQKR